MDQKNVDDGGRMDVDDNLHRLYLKLLDKQVVVGEMDNVKEEAIPLVEMSLLGITTHY